MGRWEEIDHTADLALHVWADDLRDLFATAAQGMFDLVAVPVPGAELASPAQIDLTALDVETLLVDWLNELLYLYEVRGMIFRTFDQLAVSPTHLDAVARGLPMATRLAVIKAATFHNLAVIALADGGYETEIVFDI